MATEQARSLPLPIAVVTLPSLSKWCLVSHPCCSARVQSQVTTVVTVTRRHNLTVGLDGNGVSIVSTTANSRGHLAVTRQSWCLVSHPCCSARVQSRRYYRCHCNPPPQSYRRTGWQRSKACQYPTNSRGHLAVTVKAGRLVSHPCCSARVQSRVTTVVL